MLVADVGGTKVDIAQASFHGGAIQINGVRRFASALGHCFEDILQTYLDTEPAITCDSLVIGVAGPVFGNSCTATNLPWQLHGQTIAQRFKLDHAWLINDLVAQAHGVSVSPDASRVVLNQGSSQGDQAAVIAAGTGLGEAIICRQGAKEFVIGTEGGHADFAPSNDLEIDLLRYLLKHHKRVSWERVVSGSMGFANIYLFLRTVFPDLASHPLPKDLAREEYGPRVAEAAGLGCPHAIKTLELFVKLYGAEAGNLALKCLASGGVYIAGGVATKLLPWFTDQPWFMAGFLNKGRFSSLLQTFPVLVVTDEHNALRGAAHYGLKAASK